MSGIVENGSDLEREAVLQVTAGEMVKTIDELKGNMNQINHFSELVKKQVEALGHVVNEISSSTVSMKKSAQGIKTISSQSNMLSLNAAIESARAGEAGRGFAVVAKQMGTLASTSAESSEEVLKQLNILYSDVDKIKDGLKELVEAFENQSRSSEDTFDKIENLNSLTKKIAEQ